MFREHFEEGEKPKEIHVEIGSGILMKVKEQVGTTTDQHSIDTFLNANTKALDAWKLYSKKAEFSDEAQKELVRALADIYQTECPK